MMDDDVYRKLAEHLDQLPGGFAPSETGAELRLLQRLFTPQEAELATHLTLQREDAKIIANLGNAYRQKGQLEDAERSYLMALDLEPTSVLALYGLAAVRAGEGKTGEAGGQSGYRYGLCHWTDRG